VALECRVTQRMTLGSHDLFVGEVLAVQLDDTVLDAHGRLDQARAQPLAYGGGYYWQLGECLGRFGDWRNGVR
jgi:flavin reductase (DIM6/NTAB) family NADH-FMN oxidoreductase RutF